MDVYVLRHGVADERDYREYPDDDLRPLIPEGIDKLTRQAKGLKAMGFAVDVVISSPLVRAVQTAEVVMASLEICRRVGIFGGVSSGGTPLSLAGGAGKQTS